VKGGIHAALREVERAGAAAPELLDHRVPVGGAAVQHRQDQQVEPPADVRASHYLDILGFR
jgi:hypothetical protein